MKTSKDRLFAKFEQRLSDAFPEIPIHLLRRVADTMSEDASLEVREGAKTFSDLYSEVSKKSEQHKLLFREHIELISTHTNIVMRVLLENNFVGRATYMNKSGTKLKAKTIFAKELIIFLEKLDESVQKFYTEVYEIKDKNDARELGFAQTTLF